jgi:hypothetical protein
MVYLQHPSLMTLQDKIVDSCISNCLIDDGLKLRPVCMAASNVKWYCKQLAAVLCTMCMKTYIREVFVQLSV